MKTRALFVQPRLKGISVRRQCELLQVHRSRLYYKPVGEKPENIKIMQIMDKHLLTHPTEGVISLVYFLVAKHFPVGPKRIRRLLRLMGRETLYRRKNLTRLGLKQFIKPYLLRGLTIDRPNQVWSTDITYIPMKKGFMYLTAIIDVYSRKIVGWGLSNSLTADWCKTVLQEAIANFGKPEIVNSDQGTQYTSALWTQYLEEQGYKSRWMARAGRRIISGSNGSGNPSNTTMCTSILPTMVLSCTGASMNTWPTTTRRSITQPGNHQTDGTTKRSKKQPKKPMKNDQILT